MNNPYNYLAKYLNQELTYKEFCKITNLPYLNGKAKVLQLNKVRQYVYLEQINRKIIIKDIYKESELQLIEHRGKFTTYIENILINVLYEYLKENKTDSTSQLDANKHVVILSNKDILEMAKMVNSLYFKGKLKPYEYIEDFNLHINKEDQDEFYNEPNEILRNTTLFFDVSYRLLKRVIYDSLNSMEKNSLINKSQTYVLYKKIYYTTKDGKVKYCTEPHICNDEEISRINSVIKKCVNEFNECVDEDDKGNKKYYLKNISCLYVLYPKQRELFKRILNIMIEEEFKEDGYVNYSRAWKLILSDEECFEYEVKKLNYKTLNQNVQNKLSCAKDLENMGGEIKRQLIDKFIKI
jgi:DNA-binding PadR family transcriptional regulator